MNEAAPSNSVQFAASATSNVFNGVSCILPGQQQNLFIWDSTLNTGSGLWVEASSYVDGKLNDIVSATSPTLNGNGTIATAGLGTTQVTASSALTGAILAAGIYNGQEVTVVNNAAGTNTITFAASGTSNVANGTATVISGLTCARFKWISPNWFHSV